MSEPSKFIGLKYMSRIIFVLTIIGVALSYTLGKASPLFTGQFQTLLMSISLSIFILLIPFTLFIYRRMDELQKRLHEHACVVGLSLLISLAGVTGVLQANQFLPLFNLAWFFIAGVCIWAVSLVVADYIYK